MQTERAPKLRGRAASQVYIMQQQYIYPPAQEHYDHISCLQEGEAVHVRSHGMAVSTCLWTCAAGSRPPMQTTALRRAAVRQTKL